MRTQALSYQVDREKMVLMGIILAIVVVLTILSPNFLKVRNFTNVFLQVAVIVIISSAANLLMITGRFSTCRWEASWLSARSSMPT